MAELIHTFTSGKMNKDLDERLVPNGEYRDALNLELASSDSSHWQRKWAGWNWFPKHKG